jgi:hypothetical protein
MWIKNDLNKELEFSAGFIPNRGISNRCNRITSISDALYNLDLTNVRFNMKNKLGEKVKLRTISYTGKNF